MLIKHGVRELSKVRRRLSLRPYPILVRVPGFHDMDYSSRFLGGSYSVNCYYKLQEQDPFRRLLFGSIYFDFFSSWIFISIVRFGA